MMVDTAVNTAENRIQYIFNEKPRYLIEHTLQTSALLVEGDILNPSQEDERLICGLRKTPRMRYGTSTRDR